MIEAQHLTKRYGQTVAVNEASSAPSQARQRATDSSADGAAKLYHYAT